MIKFFLLVLLVFFITGCTIPEETETQDNQTSENFTLIEEDQLEESLCTAGWKCYGTWKKAHQYENCSWGQKLECPLGCDNGSCKKGETCDAGFMCLDEERFGYRTDVCTWTKVKTCDWGCSDKKCNSAPENATNQTNETLVEEVVDVEETPPPEPVNMLNYPGQETILINDEPHNLSIKKLKSDQVLINLDGFESNWLEEGESYNYSNGVTILIKEILYEPIAGGTKAISYTIE